LPFISQLENLYMTYKLLHPVIKVVI